METPRLHLPLIAAGQAQKHVPANESFKRLDALVNVAVISMAETDPPGDPSEGDMYVAASGASGAWAGGDLNLFLFTDGAWLKIPPFEGMLVWDRDQASLLVWDGSAWELAMQAAMQNAMSFTPGGDGEVSIYRIDASSGQNPRTATVSSVSGDTITLTASVAASIFDNNRMAGVSMARIWNTTKDPIQPAWVVAQPSGTSLQVLDAGSIAGWSNGETIQLGDPTSVTPGRVFALDISPMLQTVLGRVFRQTGIMVKGGINSGTAGDDIALSPSGVGGSFVSAARTFAAATFAGEAVTIIPCTEPSPVSDSNLVFIRETIASTGTTRLISAIAVYG